MNTQVIRYLGSMRKIFVFKDLKVAGVSLGLTNVLIALLSEELRYVYSNSC